MKTILITGATGFIGNHLLGHILKNNTEEARIVLLTSVPSDDHPFVLHNGYSFSKESFIAKGFSQIDIVIHAGAYTPKSGAMANNYSDNYRNVVNTNHLLNNLPNIPEKFIFLSTLDVYQETKGIITEETPVNAASFYGVSKAYCEKMVVQFCADKGIVCQVLRLGHIYGRGEEKYKKLVPAAIRNIRQGTAPVLFSKGNEMRSYLHVSDCVSAIWAASRLKEYIGPVNVVSKNPVSIKNILELLIDISGKDLKIEYKENPIAGSDMIFDNLKMETHLVKERKNLAEGLREEYEHFDLSVQ